MGERPPQSSGGVRKLTEMYQQLITQESVAPKPKVLQKQKSSIKEPVVAKHTPELLATLGQSQSKENLNLPEMNSLTTDASEGEATPTGPSTPVEDQSSPDKVPESKSSTRTKKMSDWSSLRARSTSESSGVVSPSSANEVIDLAYRKLSNPRLSIPKIGDDTSRLGLPELLEENPGGLPRRSQTESDKKRAETVAGPLSSKYGSSTFYAPHLPLHVRASRKQSRGSPANPESKAISDLANVIGGSQPSSTGLTVKRNDSVRRPRSRSPLRHPDYYQNEDHEEQRSVADLISAYQGQSEARRKTILATCSFSVDIPKQNVDKYISRRDSFSLESSQKVPEHDSDLGTSGDPESHSIEMPQEPQILTISVLPNSVEADAPQEHVQRSPQPPRPQQPSWAGQPNVQSSGILNEISDKERKLQEAMYEVISNEQMFYKSMDIVVNHFYHSLTVRFTSETHPQFAQPLNLIFKNADKFLEISDKLLGEIDEKQADKVLVEPYFDILVKIMSTIMLKPFKRYSVMKHQQEQELENCRKDPEFAYFLDTLNNNPCTGGLTLDAFLLKPVQHATRYSLLMDAVVKRLDESDPRYKAAKRAHNEAKSFAEMINSETNLMEFLFELTTVLAGLRDIPAQKKTEVDAILSEAKKGTDIKMYGREISFGRTRRGGINFKQSEKLTIFCWSSYVLITRASEQHGHYHFLSLTDSIEASDGLDIMTELQIGSFPRGLDLTKLLLLKYFPVATTLTVERGSCAMHLLYCTSATKKKWKETIHRLNSSDD